MRAKFISKIGNSILFNIIISIPLLFSLSIFEILVDWKIIFMYTINTIVVFSQPPVDFKEMKTKSDNNTGNIIIICTMFTLVFINIDYLIERSLFIILDVFSIIICLTGLSIRIKAIHDLNKEFSNIIKKPARLKTNGLYSYVQHPSYFGSFLIYLGLAMLIGQSFSIIICIVLMVIAYSFRINYENKFLQETFNHEAWEYQHKTKMLIPYIW